MRPFQPGPRTSRHGFSEMVEWVASLAGLHTWEPVIGRSVTRWSIRRMKTKWGSCKRETGHVWFNLELAGKHTDHLEYVLVHEMTHLLERSHGGRFRRLVNDFLPDRRARRDALNESPLAHERWQRCRSADSAIILQPKCAVRDCLRWDALGNRPRIFAANDHSSCDLLRPVTLLWSLSGRPSGRPLTAVTRVRIPYALPPICREITLLPSPPRRRAWRTATHLQPQCTRPGTLSWCCWVLVPLHLV